jgi:hypothetical protein
VNQYTPYGSIQYYDTGGYMSPGVNGQGGQWVPQMSAYTTLSPGMQKLFDQNLANSQQASNTAGSLGKNVQDMLSKNVDLGPGATQAYLDRLNTQTLDPQWKQGQAELNQQLENQGLTPGSAGWNYQQSQFGLNKANAYNNMYLQGQNTAVQDILAQYNEPLNALSALQSRSQVSQPGIGTLAPTAQSQIQPANYQGIVENNANLAMQQYQAQMQSNNAMMGGLFGLGGSLLSGGLGMMSDERDKKDIEKLGEKDGLPIYSYNYKTDSKSAPKRAGPMAQDVEKKYPGSTTEIGGHKVIKFGLGS